MRKTLMALMLVCAVSMISLGLAGCQRHQESSSDESATTEHPTTEQPANEHPSTEHPK